MANKRSRALASICIIISVITWTCFIRAGTLEFDGVPVDITTANNEDLVIVPASGGNIQIGAGSGTNSYATSNNDLHVTGILEVSGSGYFDSGLTVASALTANGNVTLGSTTSNTITPTGKLAADLVPNTSSTYNLGSTSLAFSKLYVDTISGYAAALALSPASGYSLTGAVTKSASSGNETAYDLAATVNKSSSGNYTGLKLNVTETLAPGTADKLMDLQVGGTSWLSVYNGANSANYGALSLGSGYWDGTTAGYFSGSTSGTLLAGNAVSAFAGNLIDIQIAGSSKFKVDSSGNVTVAGTIASSSSLGGSGTNKYLSRWSAATESIPTERAWVRA